MVQAVGGSGSRLRELLIDPSFGNSESDTDVSGDLARAIGRLTSLHDGDVGLIETVAFGKCAVAPLREILFKREPSGLYETRRRAVEALAQVGAYDVLIEYLETPRTISDPIELTGEEAVINAAARMLARAKHPMVTKLLLDLTRRPPLVGVVDALGELRCADAVPYLINALAEDFTRSAAEGAIRKLGPSMRRVLLRRALERGRPGEIESETNKRCRTSALRLYGEFGALLREDWSSIHELMTDSDARISVLAGEMCLREANGPAKVAAIVRFVELLGEQGWMLDQEIEDCLVKYFDAAKAIVADVLRLTEQSDEFDSPRAQRARVLRRIIKRGSARVREDK
jgi:hypothetical protein